MRIGIEGQRLFRKKKHGMDMVALELIRNLQIIDKTNDYFVFIKPDEDDTCLNETENFKIVQVKALSYPIWEQIKLPQVIKRYKLDLMHYTSNTAPIFTRVPFVLTLHDIIFLEKKSVCHKGFNLYQRFGNFYRKKVVPIIVKKALIITTVSSYELAVISQYFDKQKHKLEFIYNGVSEHFEKITSDPKIEGVRAKYNLAEKFIFAFGNTDPKKNTPGIIEAYGKYCKLVDNPIPLLLLDLDKNDLLSILKRINNIELLDHIQLTGYISNADLPIIYSLSEFFLFPSLRESFGIPLLEAMRCETAVISSNSSALREIAGDAAILVDPTSVEEIANAILDLSKNPELRTSLIQKGIKNSKKYSWQAMAIEFQKLYVRAFD
ncbi:MAG: glycosyltransferase family 4 protein [Cytophagia bacterium]|jgi:glycosyltransferase involved in cell wall biosynthesis|nr:glycosyltransferase family 4 protein [Bacteroidota bacterium]MBT5530340.1 glycosyltransferase family 4 protein [Cytophagia bacterium]MBT7993935.1 glycosyltransferase family 4 protein [Bacteroidota bacterium]